MDIEMLQAGWFFFGN